MLRNRTSAGDPYYLIRIMPAQGSLTKWYRLCPQGMLQYFVRDAPSFHDKEVFLCHCLLLWMAV